MFEDAKGVWVKFRHFQGFFKALRIIIRHFSHFYQNNRMDETKSAHPKRKIIEKKKP